MNKNEYFDEKKKKKRVFSLFFSFITPFKVLFNLHLKLLKKELKEDFIRYTKGVLFLILSILIFFIMLLLLNCFIVVILKYYLFSNQSVVNSLIFSLLAAIGINLLAFILFLLGVYFSFRKPFLKETRKAINETLKNLG